jgi:hypothetical protein
VDAQLFFWVHVSKIWKIERIGRSGVSAEYTVLS